MNAQKVGNIWLDLSELKACIDLTDIYGTNKVLCPWHNDHDPSLHIYPDHVYCFACGMTADAITFVCKMENLTFDEAVKFLLEYRRPTRVKQQAVTTAVDAEEVYQPHQRLMGLPSWSYAWRWLSNRGLGTPIVRDLTVGWTGKAYSIPHFANGTAFNVKYRVHPQYLREGEHKYTSLPHHGFSFPYPWDFFRLHHGNSPVLFVVEGEFDAMVLLQASLPALSIPSGAGTSWSPWTAFFRRFKHIFVLYDMDEAGTIAARKLVEEKNKLGKTMVEMLNPTEVHRLTWPVSWGKDITDARRLLVPKVRGIYEQVV